MRGKAASWYDVIDPRVILALPAADVSTAVVLADRRAIKNVFQAFGRVKNERDGREVIFPAASVGKMWFNSGVDIRGIASEFANLFRVAVRAWSEPNAKIPLDDKRRKLEAIHQYVAKFSNRAGSYYIRFTVKENTGGNIPRAEVHASVVSSISIYKTEGAELSTPIKTQAEDSAPFVGGKVALFWLCVNGATGSNVLLPPFPSLFEGRIPRRQGRMEVELLARALVPVDCRPGDWWLVIGGWWLVVGGWWLVIGGW